MTIVEIKEGLCELIRKDWENMIAYCADLAVELDGVSTAEDEKEIAIEIRRKADSLIAAHQALAELRKII